MASASQKMREEVYEKEIVRGGNFSMWVVYSEEDSGKGFAHSTEYAMEISTLLLYLPAIIDVSMRVGILYVYAE